MSPCVTVHTVVAEGGELQALVPELHRRLEGMATLQLRPRPTAASGAEPDTSAVAPTANGATLILAEFGDQSPQDLIERVRAWRASPSRPEIVVAGPVPPPEALIDLMRAGVGEFLPYPLNEAEVEGALKRAIERSGTARVARPRSARMTAVFSSTGGVGTSTVAVNLALALQAIDVGPLLLIDLSLPGGGCEALLDLSPRYGVSDLIRNLERLDLSLLRSYVTEHPSGIALLGSPRSELDAESITPEQVSALIKAVSPHYPTVIVDAGGAVVRRMLPVLRDADQLVQVLTPSITCLRNARRHLPVLEQQVQDLRARTLTVLNRSDPDIAIGALEVRRALGLEVNTELPLDLELQRRAAEGGHPSALASGSPFGRSLRRLAEDLSQRRAMLGKSTDDSASQHNGLIDRFFRGRQPNKASSPSSRPSPLP